MTVDDDIALLASDIRRYSNNDGRIDEALTQLLKVYQAEVDALAEEARELTIELGKHAITEIADPMCEVCGRPSPTTWCPTCVAKDTDGFWDMQNNRTRA